MSTTPHLQLTHLGLADSEAVVYMAMVKGSLSARDIMKATGQKRPTVYYALGCLERRGLVAKTGLSGARQFALAPAERLSALARERVKEAETLSREISSAIPLFTPAASAEQRPSVAFFEGKEAVSRVVMDMLYNKEGRIDVLAPSDNFFWQIGYEFVERFVNERRRRGIRTRSLWEAPIKRAVLKEYYEALSEVRIVPASMRGKFSSSVFLYDDQTLYVSSLKNSYAVLITSKEHHDTMRAWFDGLWGASKPHPGS